jgi:hypothetical protein
MSRWLRNVGQFLENLDNRAEQVAQEQEDDARGAPGESSIESILAARGLLDADGEEDLMNNDTNEEEEEEDAIEFDGGVADIESTGGIGRVENAESAESTASVQMTDDETPALIDDGISNDTQHTQSSAENVASSDFTNHMDINTETPHAVDAVPEDAMPESSLGIAESSEASTDNLVSDDAEIADNNITHVAPPLTTELLPSPDGENSADVVSDNDTDTNTDQDTSRSMQTDNEQSSDLPEYAQSEEEKKVDNPGSNYSIDTSATHDERPVPRVSASPFATAALSSSINLISSLLPPNVSNTRESLSEAPESHGTLPTNSKHQQLQRQSSEQTREAQKEARLLRRHVVSLNSQLEKAEAELQAQRIELERAGELMEQDRNKNRTLREQEQARQTEEVKKLKASHEAAIKDMKQRYDQQTEELRRQLKDLENRRMQEGGDWNKELAEAMQREQEMTHKCAFLEDEKLTLLNHITTLQSQQEALGSRVESLMQTTDLAMERERDAEQRLDETLSLHARQITQRQTREAELERTITELGAALVQARNDAKSANGQSTTALKDSYQSSLVESLQQEIENLNTQLTTDGQRCKTLQTEVDELTRERLQEASSNTRRIHEYDRRINEMTQTITQLTSELNEAKRMRESSIHPLQSRMDQADEMQIQSLSEEVIRLREKQRHANSEISTLKSRLQTANDRVSKFETLEHDRREFATSSYDIEDGPVSGSSEVRRRGGKKQQAKYLPMRSALRLEGSYENQRVSIGKALDGIDAFLVSSGKVLRFNPAVRLLFIMYLLLLHLWTFLLIVIHAHGFEAVHGDFGAGSSTAHGPHALMQKSPVEEGTPP